MAIPSPSSGTLDSKGGITALGGAAPRKRADTRVDFKPGAVEIAKPLAELASRSLDIQIKQERFRLENELLEGLEQGREEATQQLTPQEVDEVYGEAEDRANAIVEQLNPEDQADLGRVAAQRILTHKAGYLGPRKVELIKGRATALRVKREENRLRSAETAGSSLNYRLTRDLIETGLLEVADDHSLGLLTEPEAALLGASIVDSTWAATIQGMIDNKDDPQRFKTVRILLENDEELISTMSVKARLGILDAVKSQQSTKNYLKYAVSLAEDTNAFAHGERDRLMLQKMRKDDVMSEPHWLQADNLRKSAQAQSKDWVDELVQAQIKCEAFGRSIWECLNPNSDDLPKQVNQLYKTGYMEKVNDAADLQQPPPNIITYSMEFMDTSGHIPNDFFDMALTMTQSRDPEQEENGYKLLMSMDDANTTELHAKSATPHAKNILATMNNFRQELYGSDGIIQTSNNREVTLSGASVIYDAFGTPELMNSRMALDQAKQNASANKNNPEGRQVARRAVLTAEANVPETYAADISEWGSTHGSVMSANALNKAFETDGIFQTSNVFSSSDFNKSDLHFMIPYVTKTAIAIQAANRSWSERAAYESAAIEVKNQGHFKDEFNGRGKEIVQFGVDNPALRNITRKVITGPNGQERDLGNGWMRADVIMQLWSNTMKLVDDPVMLAKMQKGLDRLNSDNVFLTGKGVLVAEDSGFPQTLDPSLTRGPLSHLGGFLAGSLGFSNTLDSGPLFFTGSQVERSQEQMLLSGEGASQAPMFFRAPDPESMRAYDGLMEIHDVPNYTTNEHAAEIMAFEMGITEAEAWRMVTFAASDGHAVNPDVHWEPGFYGDAETAGGRKADGSQANISFNIMMMFDDENMEDAPITMGGNYDTTYRYEPTNVGKSRSSFNQRTQPVEFQKPPDSEMTDEQVRIEAINRKRFAESERTAKIMRGFDQDALWADIKQVPDKASGIITGILELIDNGGDF